MTPDIVAKLQEVAKSLSEDGYMVDLRYQPFELPDRQWDVMIVGGKDDFFQSWGSTIEKAIEGAIKEAGK